MLRVEVAAGTLSDTAVRDFPPGLDPELAALALLGPIFYRRLMSGEPFDPDRAGELVDTVLGTV